MEPIRNEGPRRQGTFLPTVAVSAVAAAAIATAVMVKRAETPGTEVAQQSTSATDVVTAPPLKAPDTRAMGAASACSNCGIVQMVVAVHEQGRDQPRAYQMHIRMDDGSMRTFEQRGALAAGSRVQVDGSKLKPLS